MNKNMFENFIRSFRFGNIVFLPIVICFLFLSPALLAGQDSDSEREPTREEIELHRNRLIQAGFLQEEHEVFPKATSASDFSLEYVFYTDKIKNVATISSRGTEFRNNGSRFYILGRTSQNVIEYHMSTSWDITTAQYQREFDFSDVIGTGENPFVVPHGLFIRQSDGNKMWIFNRTEIWEFTLSTPWDITSASQTGYKDLSDEILRGHDIHFRNNGSRLYIDDRIQNVVLQYELSEPWDIETMSLDYVLQLTSDFEEVRGLQLTHEGDRLYLVDAANQLLNEFYLSTPHDLRSASFVDDYSLASESNNPRAVVFNSDFSGFYITDETEERVYQYRVSLPPDPVLTTIESSKDKVRANNLDSSLITVTVRDAENQRLEGFKTRLIVGDAQIELSPSSSVTDSNGESLFEVKSTSLQNVEIGAAADDIVIDNTVLVEFIGIDPSLSTIEASKNRVLANGESQAEIVVTARDEFGNAFDNIRIDLDADEDHTTIEVVQRRTDDDGIAIFRVSSETASKVSYRASSMGITIDSEVLINFVRLDPDKSLITQNISRVQANGENYGEIVVVVLDEDGEPIGNVDVILIPDNGHSSIEVIQGSTNADGEAIFRVSNNTPETVTYKAEGMGTTISDSVEFEFLGIDAELSSIASDANRVQADGSSSAELIIEVKDEDGEAFSYTEIELFADSDNVNINNVQSITDSEGIAIFEVSNPVIERVTFGARGLGTTLIDTHTIEFVPVSPVVLNASDVGTRSFTANWELLNGIDGFILEVAFDEEFTTYLTGYDGLDVGFETSKPIETTPGTTHYYRVRAYRNDLEGAFSETTEVTTFPETPVAANATNRNAIHFTANWSEAEGARSYHIDVARDPSFEFIIPEYEDLQVDLSTSLKVDNLDLGTNYYYRVRSEAGYRVSDNSNVIATSTLTVSPEISEIEQEQLRTMANGIQVNTVTVSVKNEDGIALEGLLVSLNEDNQHQTKIKGVQSTTNEEGLAIFKISSLSPGKIKYTAVSRDIEIGTFEIEFLADAGKLSLGQNYPNPFNQRTILPVTVPRAMNIEIKVYDMLGRMVQIPLNERKEAGYYEIPFEGHSLSSGIYLYRLFADGEIITKRMVLVR